MKFTVGTIVASQFAIALLIEAVSGYRYSPPLLTFIITATVLSVLVVSGLSFFWLAQMARKRTFEPRKILISRLKKLDVPFVYGAVAAQFCVLGWLKAAMPHSVGFHADQMLADADAWIFGTDVWRLVQWLPPTLVDTAYVTWAQSTFVLMAILPILPRSEKRDRAIMSFFLMMAAAATFQYAMPSAGPIFFERLGFGHRFAELPSRPWAELTSNYLWNSYLDDASRIGSGISAFPSLHVAGAAWVAAVVSSYSRKLAPIAWAYFVLILLGSVYLGWHYALDGIAGMLITIFVWRLVAWRQKSGRPMALEASI